MNLKEIRQEVKKRGENSINLIKFQRILFSEWTQSMTKARIGYQLKNAASHIHLLI